MNERYPLEPTELRSKEAAEIRRNLKLRWNEIYESWEVYTTVHGTGVFRWYRISTVWKNWYRRNFKDIPTAPNVTMSDTGGFTQ